MSVVINSNSAATVASNNLAASSSSLQRSLNRLSSGSKIVNSYDDAGGLAVAMKLSAAAKRSAAAANNIGNVTSYLQTQDGVLKTAGKVLDRMSELWTLYKDPTKNSNDLANYNAEFTQLQKEISSLTGETFNGTKLFGATGATGNNKVIESVLASEDGASSSVAITAKDLASTTAGIGNLLPDVNATDARSALVTALATYKGSAKDATALAAFKAVATANIQTPTTLNTAIDDYVAIATNGAKTVTEVATAEAALTTATTGAFDVAIGSGLKTGGANLSTISALTTITTAMQNVATMRANNGAEQSRLGFATEVLSVNKTNIEAATSRIMDVDVAEESTQLARWNILVQAGTAMLSQANQSAQSAMRLLQ